MAAALAIFICYRREDSIAYAGRLYDRLVAHFGRSRVFMDVDAIEPGEDFVDAIERRVGHCDALIAVIGRKWLDADASGVRRIDSPEDFVRVEIAAALNRGVRVIPVLVGGATMPRSTDLPDALQALARRNALEISDTAFHQGVARLIEALSRITPGDRKVGDSDAHRSGENETTTGGSAAGTAVAELVRESTEQDSDVIVTVKPRDPAGRLPLLVRVIAVVAVLTVTALALVWRRDPIVPHDEKGAQVVKQETDKPSTPGVVEVIQPGLESAPPAKQLTSVPGDIQRKPVRPGGAIPMPARTKFVPPTYPDAARIARVAGIVIAEVQLDTSGRVHMARILRSVPLLDQAAIDAVMQWEFAPTYVDGTAVPVVMAVAVPFTLPE